MSQTKGKFIKWGAAFLGLYLNWRLRRRRQRRSVDIIGIDTAMARLISRPAWGHFSKRERQKYVTSMHATEYWHGTGRLQYDGRGRVIDVFEQMLAQGSLRPFKDILDITQGEMVSTSVTRQRMYARIYADMHVYGGAGVYERYGSPRFWLYYFVMAINLHETKVALKRYGLATLPVFAFEQCEQFHADKLFSQLVS